jgi:hypothetical protein
LDEAPELVALAARLRGPVIHVDAGRVFQMLAREHRLPGRYLVEVNFAQRLAYAMREHGRALPESEPALCSCGAGHWRAWRAARLTWCCRFPDLPVTFN